MTSSNIPMTSSKLCPKCTKLIHQYDKFALRVNEIQVYFNSFSFASQTKPKVAEVVEIESIELCDDENDDVEEKLKFSCQICNLSFSSRLSYKIHLKTHNVRNPENDPKSSNLMMCEYCGETFAKSFLFIKHKKNKCKVKNAGPWTCDFEGCGRVYEDNTKFKDHRRHHASRTTFIPCETCGKSFKPGYVMEQHKKIHLNLKENLCPLCPCRYNQIKNLRTHIKQRHEENYYEDPQSQRNDLILCTQCTEKCKTVKAFVQHMTEAHAFVNHHATQ